LKGGISSGNILNGDPYLFLLTSIGDDILNTFPVISLCRAFSSGGAGLQPKENPKCSSGASQQALQNGFLRFVAATNTRIYISFAMNHVSPSPFWRLASGCRMTL